ncbi:MAG: nucleotidyltransferase [Verrucomicrobia bacterium]|nr:MAG: nucleotidyltransferase [Verrucomicrobiota bacterium]
MTRISEAVVLMAGKGSRMRGLDKALLKPFVPILGRPLISSILNALVRAGIKTVNFVVGYESERMIAQVKELIPSSFDSRFIENPDWQKQNGISLLTAASHVGRSFLLTMSDHLFDQSIVDLLLRNAVMDRLNVALDRKLDSIFDLDDAMKVQTRGNRILKIGKHLTVYDGIDTGLFVCPPEIFDHLERAKRDGDCSLADGVRSMASEGKARAVDILDAWWQDIDTIAMLACAERQLRSRLAQHDVVFANSGSDRGDRAEN